MTRRTKGKELKSLLWWEQQLQAAAQNTDEMELRAINHPSLARSEGGP